MNLLARGGDTNVELSGILPTPTPDTSRAGLRLPWKPNKTKFERNGTHLVGSYIGSTDILTGILGANVELNHYFSTILDTCIGFAL